LERSAFITLCTLSAAKGRVIEMKISQVQRDEPNEFCQIKGAREISTNTMIELWDNEISKPEWCFIVEVGNNGKGRIGFFKAGDEKNLNMFALHFPGLDDANSATPEMFLTEIFGFMRNKGVLSINYHLDSETENHIMLLEVLKKTGMQVTQSKKSYLLERKASSKPSQNRLDYKTLSEVGKEAFLTAISEVTQGTLDREDERVYKERGKEKAAEEHMNLLKDIGDRDDTWYLAYEQGVFVGLVIPQKIDKQTGVINYIGVVPAQRGKGYVSALLEKGISSLFQRKFQRIIADIDELNFPMEKALKKLGFKEDKKIWVLNISLKKE